MKKTFIFVAIATFALLTACGSDSSSSADDADVGNDAVSSSDESVISSSSVSVSFGTMTDSRDNQVYKTTTIGEQTWMAENLDYAYTEPTAMLDSSSFCYNNKADSCAKYGRLYLWSAAMDSAAKFSDDGAGCGNGTTCSLSGAVRGICPEGWHLPSKEEWEILFANVGGQGDADAALKSSREDWGYTGPSVYTNEFGFSALPAGRREDNGISAGFYDVGSSTNFWTSNAYADYHAYQILLQDIMEYADICSFYKDQAYSVRCVKDN